MSRFKPRQAFGHASSYKLLPLRFRRLPWDETRAFVSSMAGDWLLMDMADLQRFVSHELSADSPLLADLQARHLAIVATDRSSLSPLLSQIRTRKSYMVGGPALHIFVVSLRCHHTCSYCQVSRQATTATAFDMTGSHAEQAVERLFEWPSQELTIEFQGGEPLLNFEQVMASRSSSSSATFPNGETYDLSWLRPFMTSPKANWHFWQSTVLSYPPL